MSSFTPHEHLRRYRKLLIRTSDETVRSQLFKLIADEERQQILEERDWSSSTEILIDSDYRAMPRRSSAKPDNFLQTAYADCNAGMTALG